MPHTLDMKWTAPVCVVTVKSGVTQHSCLDMPIMMKGTLYSILEDLDTVVTVPTIQPLQVLISIALLTSRGAMIQC